MGSVLRQHESLEHFRNLVELQSEQCRGLRHLRGRYGVSTLSQVTPSSDKANRIPEY